MQQETGSEGRYGSILSDGGRTLRSSGMFGAISALFHANFSLRPALGKEIPLVHRRLHWGAAALRCADCRSCRIAKHLADLLQEIVKAKIKLKVVVRDLGSSNRTW